MIWRFSGGRLGLWVYWVFRSVVGGFDIGFLNDGMCILRKISKCFLNINFIFSCDFFTIGERLCVGEDVFFFGERVLY